MTDHHAPPRPEQAAPATVGHRAAARLIDAVLVGVLGGALGVLLDFSLLWLALQAALVFGYFVALDTALGTTVGKRVLGLRIEGPTGGRPTLSQGLAREAFVLLGAIPYVGPVLALAAWVAIVVSIRSNPYGQGLHDRFAGGTLVSRA
jgi:uncharacterized RDD family membrane protein YckC